MYTVQKGSGDFPVLQENGRSCGVIVNASFPADGIYVWVRVPDAPAAGRGLNLTEDNCDLQAARHVLSVLRGPPGA